MIAMAACCTPGGRAPARSLNSGGRPVATKEWERFGKKWERAGARASEVASHLLACLWGWFSA